MNATVHILHRLEKDKLRQEGQNGSHSGLELERHLHETLAQSGLFQNVRRLSREEDQQEHVDMEVTFGGFVLKVQIKSSWGGANQWGRRFRHKANWVMIFVANNRLSSEALLAKFLAEAREFLEARVSYNFALPMLPTLTTS